MSILPNIIYQAKNEQRKCFYIGYTTKGLVNRKNTHYRACFNRNLTIKFYNFLRKYGWNSFEWEILASYLTKEELPQAEIKWLKEQKERFSDWECLNLTEGGDGIPNPSKEIREKMRISHLGKKLSKKTLELLSKIHKGKPKTESHRKAIGESHKKENLSKKSIENYRKAQLGKRHTLESKEKNRVVHIGMFKGDKHPFFNKHHTPESREKNRKSHLGKYNGEKSPSAKLNEKEVIEILQYLKNRVLSQSQIAKKFNISKTTINKINTKKLWKYLDREKI